MKQRVRAILIDVLGFALIIASGLLGWLPGPGGIPLLILGLSLLATNHEWAERLLHHVRVKGVDLFEKLFNGGKKTKWIVDLIGVAIITIAVLLATQVTRSIAHTAAISLGITSLFLLASNRKRYQYLFNKVKRNKHKR